MVLWNDWGNAVANRLQVLVIDDDAADRMLMRRHLAFAGGAIDVEEADTGKSGIALLQARKFDCVFVDYRLPDMEGTALLQNFYDINTDQMPAPFVMLTGQGGEAVMAEALRWGAHDYIVKDNVTTAAVMISLAKAREIFDLKKARNSAEEKLRHAQKMDAVGQLTSGVAHDFNNLLTVILGNTRLMHRRLEALSDPDARTAITLKVEAVESAARRGADLIRHLMVFSRQRELKEDIVDIGQSVRATVELLQRTLGERVEVRIGGVEETPPVGVDSTLLENAMINIAVNARDAMPGGGSLTFSVTNAPFNGNDYALITVSDTGCGMPEHVRERIFEPFYTTKPAGEGTGLGLAMVYGFVRQTGGHIEVESAEGQGTTFKIYLPPAQASKNREKSNAG